MICTAFLVMSAGRSTDSIPGSEGERTSWERPPAAKAPADGATASETREHRVRRGDTLSRIARQYGVDLRQLYRLNRLNGRSILQPGQVLRIDP